MVEGDDHLDAVTKEYWELAASYLYSDKELARSILGSLMVFASATCGTQLEPQDRQGVMHHSRYYCSDRVEFISRIFVRGAHGDVIASFPKVRKTFQAACVSFCNFAPDQLWDVAATKWLAIADNCKCDLLQFNFYAMLAQFAAYKGAARFCTIERNYKVACLALRMSDDGIDADNATIADVLEYVTSGNDLHARQQFAYATASVEHPLSMTVQPSITMAFEWACSVGRTARLRLGQR